MRSIYEHDPIRIPVKLVDGQWEYFYGGDVPVRSGAVGDLIIDKGSIENKDFLARISRVSKHQILEEGAELLVALTIKDLPRLGAEAEAILKAPSLKDIQLGNAYYFTPRSADTRVVSIFIGKATKLQEQIDPKAKGGVWLNVQGLEPKGITSSSIQLPKCVTGAPADSLNHAFTLLSEKFEPWRKSHTGNIYDRILYQEKNGKWYPMSVLRNAAIATEEHQLIRGQWVRISEALRKDNDRGR